MQKWEICILGSKQVTKKTRKCVAYLLTPEGTKIIAEGAECKFEEYRWTEWWKQKQRVIAQLGLEGWEPMLVFDGYDSIGDARREWYFKRPIPPETAQEAE